VTPHRHHAPPLRLVGDGRLVPLAGGGEAPYLSCDAAASTSPFESVVAAVASFMPWYSSVHRGAGYKSQLSTAAYEGAREAMLRFAGRDAKCPDDRGPDDRARDDIAIICRNTTEALNHLAYRLRLAPDDVVVTTVVEHHANLLPWSRSATCRYVECEADGTFSVEAVVSALSASPRPRLLAVTGASNITGWMPPIDALVEAAHERGVPVVVDAAQLAPHRPLPVSPDYIAWSGHKMYAPFGAGVLIGPRSAFETGDPFLAGGGAVDLVELDDVVWSEPPEREEAGSPNVVGAVAMRAAIEMIDEIGWESLVAHDLQIATVLRRGIASVPGVRLLGPGTESETLPVATFVVDGMPHALVAARLSAEEGIGVRHGCFCAHPYLMRLLGLGRLEVDAYRRAVRAGDRTSMPGAVRASLGLNASFADVSRLCAALRRISSGDPAPVEYVQDPATGDFHPVVGPNGWPGLGEATRAGCSPG
jgi:selenocysteine lyase/cysteine desulfurase